LKPNLLEIVERANFNVLCSLFFQAIKISETSPTFFEELLCQKVQTKKLRVKLLYSKAARKMLVKLSKDQSFKISLSKCKKSLSLFGPLPLEQGCTTQAPWRAK
jgi:hypothetical protein